MEEPGSPQDNKAESLLALAKGPLAASAARLSAHSRAVPAGRDFHFYRNFDEFGASAKELASRSEALLTSIVSSEIIGGKLGDSAGHPEDLEDAHDWVVLLNDELLEQFGASMDEFRRFRMEEESGTAADKAAEMEAGGFRIVQSRKNKKNRNNGGVDDSLGAGSPLGVKVASRDKRTNGPRSQVPFHIASIPRPQDTFKILVNNSNQPFEHVWLERSEDGSQFVHPLEKLSVINFIDRNIGKDEPMKPPPISDTPFKFVEEVKDLKELASKLRAVDEFAVDLEHNQYRSFQGLTCLMQISTRTEDFLVDTLKLRIHIGPHLREVFKDPSKRKVMHGADRDILWLQRDFGIYVCNLFDTGQASRVLQLERNSLEFLLQHFCEVTANKEYQQADWRLRPLPEEMIKYAREDTHYLLYIYDVMRRQLVSESSVSDPSDSLLAEVYRRSSDICLQLYEKELLTDSSYLRIYGLSETDFNPRQIAIVAGLWEWRDYVARAEDESTGYILPNKALLEIARQMPMTCGMLRKLVKSKHPYVEQNLESVISVIKNAVVNAASFEPIVEYLKNSRLEMRNGGTDSTAMASDPLPVNQSTIAVNGGVVESKTGPWTLTNIAEVKESPKPVSVNSVLVQRKEKPTGAFGALFGAPSIKRKLTPESLKVNAGQGEANSKVEQIRSSVALPFRPFPGGITLPAGRQLSTSAEPPVDPGPATSEQTEDVVQQVDRVAGQGEDIILLAEEQSSPVAATGHWDDVIEVVEEQTPLSGEEQTAPLAAARRWEPFDYAAARKEVKFGDRREERASMGNSTGSGGSSSGGGGPAVSEFSAPRRCQAYPASGNRSATFR